MVFNSPSRQSDDALEVTAFNQSQQSQETVAAGGIWRIAQNLKFGDRYNPHFHCAYPQSTQQPRKENTRNYLADKIPNE